MLARSLRLRHSRDIERVYKQGRYGASDYLSVKVLQGRGQISRATVVVAKKVSKKAVVRNSLRRRILEILARHWQRIQPGCDIVVTVKQDASDLAPTALDSEVVQALTKAKALTNV